jgi:hypothetical protein
VGGESVVEVVGAGGGYVVEPGVEAGLGDDPGLPSFLDGISPVRTMAYVLPRDRDRRCETSATV